MELLKRSLTAGVLLAIVYFFVMYSTPFIFFLGVQIFSFLALYEFLNIVFREEQNNLKVIAFFNSFIVALSFYLNFNFLFSVFLIILLSGVFLLFSTKNENLKDFPLNFSLLVFSPLYVIFTLSFLYKIFLFDRLLIFFIIAVISVGDTSAYIFGKTFGKKKIFPIASPKKTVIGFFADLLVAPLTAYLSWIWFLKMYNFMFLLKSAIFIALISQLSDPVESLFKRWKGIKDSSNLLPGHGGFLDRVDAYIFSSPLFYFLLETIKPIFK